MNLNSKQGYLTGKSAPDKHFGYSRKVPASIEVGSRATPYPNHGPIALDSGGVEHSITYTDLRWTFWVRP